jgi:hypothetical protein
VLSREATNTNFIFLGLTQPGLEPTIYCTRGEHANYYTTDAVTGFWRITTYITPKQRKSSSITCKTNLIRLILNTSLKVGYFLEIFYRLKLGMKRGNYSLQKKNHSCFNRYTLEQFLIYILIIDHENVFINVMQLMTSFSAVCFSHFGITVNIKFI